MTDTATIEFNTRIAHPIRYCENTAGYALSRNCVPRAIAIAGQAAGLTGYDQRSVIASLTSDQRAWIAAGRTKTARAVRRKNLTARTMSARSGTYLEVSRAWLTKRGWTRQGYRSGELTVAGLPTYGVFIVKIRKHLMALIDGVIHDGYDSRVRPESERFGPAVPRTVFALWSPPCSTVTVRLGNRWVEEAESRGLDIGTVVRRTKTITILAMTRGQYSEAVSAADCDATVFGSGSIDYAADYRWLGRAAARASTSLARQSPEWA